MPTYANGTIPLSAMKQFRNTGKYGHPVFIDRLEAAFQELERAGYKPYIAAGQDIYRDLAGQRYWKTYWTNLGKPGNAAAVGRSKHGLGVSADISGVPKNATVIAIFKRHNIEFNYPPETWHVSDTSINTYGDTQVVITPASTIKFSQTVKNEQAWLNKSRGEKLTVDGLKGAGTTAAFKRYQTFLRTYGYTGAIDGNWGAGTQAAHAKYYAAYNTPKRATIKQGSRGADVKYLQSKLGLAQDSIFGPATKAKVVAWQKSKGLTPDGIVGPKSWAKLG
jgi:hypothetical protein